MSREAAFSALITYLDANLSGVSVTRVANDPRRHGTGILHAEWPTDANKLVAVYAANSTIGTKETGGRFRRLQDVLLLMATADESQADNAVKLDALVDDIDALLRDGVPGAASTEPARTETVSEAPAPIAAEVMYIRLNYCGGE